jgi:hypothetical protein
LWLYCYRLALQWFKSYIGNRKQYVVLGDTQSELLDICHGVPQGSVLGPLLFLIFINDIVETTSFFKFILFADDSTLSAALPFENYILSANQINRELQKVSMWLKANKICINIKKTKYILFSYRRNAHFPCIKIGDGLIEETNSAKFLGIIIDKNLTFKEHISYIGAKISKSIGILNKVKNFLPAEALQIMYRTLIHPYLQYGIEACHGTNKN